MHHFLQMRYNMELRILRRDIDEEDSAEVDLTFNTLMGDKVPPRKKFIEENAVYATLDI